MSKRFPIALVLVLTILCVHWIHTFNNSKHVAYWYMIYMYVNPQVSKMTSWHARAGVLGYLQVVVFCNLFLMLEPEKVRQVQDLVVELICDDQLEVR